MQTIVSTKLRRIAARVGRTVAVSATVAALGVGAMTRPAAADQTPLSGSMTITAASCCNDYTVRVSGHAHMTQAEAQRHIDHGVSLRFQLFGRDAGDPDDPIAGSGMYGYARFHFTNFAAWSDGLYFTGSMLVDGADLNEDSGCSYWNPFCTDPWGQDELYGVLRLVDPDTKVVTWATTNQVNGYWT